MNFFVGGTATSGADFTSIGTTVEFAANSSTATKTVSVLDDSTVEVDETVVVTIAPSVLYTVNPPSSATVMIQDDDAVTVTVIATVPNAGESNSDNYHGMFWLARTGPTSAALTVNFTVSGSATSGVDYRSIGNSITFPAGRAAAGIPIQTLQDNAVESGETVVLTLNNGGGYTVGTSSSATVTIHDDDFSVTVTATDATAG